MRITYMMYCAYKAYSAFEQYAEAKRFSRNQLSQIVSAVTKKNLGDYNSAVQSYNEVMLEAIEFLNSLYEHLPKSTGEMKKAEKLAKPIGMAEKLSH